MPVNTPRIGALGVAPLYIAVIALAIAAAAGVGVWVATQPSAPAAPTTTQACNMSSAPACGGICPGGESCQSVTGNKCRCVVGSASCGNGACDAGENCVTCPSDCGQCPSACGNGACDSGETCTSCPSDCGQCPPGCGNGACDSGETCTSCPSDCGQCPPDCGNDICEFGEDCNGCPQDCRCPCVLYDGIKNPGETCDKDNDCLNYQTPKCDPASCTCEPCRERSCPEGSIWDNDSCQCVPSCEASDIMLCDGKCEDGYICLPDLVECKCMRECSSSGLSCDGACPPGQHCLDTRFGCECNDWCHVGGIMMDELCDGYVINFTVTGIKNISGGRYCELYNSTSHAGNTPVGINPIGPLDVRIYFNSDLSHCFAITASPMGVAVITDPMPCYTPLPSSKMPVVASRHGPFDYCDSDTVETSYVQGHPTTTVTVDGRVADPKGRWVEGYCQITSTTTMRGQVVGKIVRLYDDGGYMVDEKEYLLDFDGSGLALLDELLCPSGEWIEYCLPSMVDADPENPCKYAGQIFSVDVDPSLCDDCLPYDPVDHLNIKGFQEHYWRMSTPLVEATSTSATITIEHIWSMTDPDELLVEVYEKMPDGSLNEVALIHLYSPNPDGPMVINVDGLKPGTDYLFAVFGKVYTPESDYRYDMYLIYDPGYESYGHFTTPG